MVDVDGTGLVDTISLEAAETMTWQATAKLRKSMRNVSRASKPRNDHRRGGLDFDDYAFSCLRQAYGENTISTVTAAASAAIAAGGYYSAVSAASELFENVGPVPSFAPPKQGPGSISAQNLVGYRVKVYWPADDWYPGVIDAYDKVTKRHHVKYDDGDMRWYTMTEDRKHAVSESSNRLPMQILQGGSSRHGPSSSSVSKSRHVLIEFLDAGATERFELGKYDDPVQGFTFWVRLSSKSSFEEQFDDMALGATDAQVSEEKRMDSLRASSILACEAFALKIERNDRQSQQRFVLSLKESSTKKFQLAFAREAVSFSPLIISCAMMSRECSMKVCQEIVP